MLTEKIQLETDEVILKQVRKHWFFLVAQIISFVIAALAPAFLAFVLYTFSDNAFIETILTYRPHLTYLYTIWLVLIWMALFNAWTDYYLDVWTITNRRLIAINQQGLFRRSISSFRLERLQDMNVQIDGIVATFLDFGSIDVQTAGHGDDHFEAHNLPHPRELKSLILKATDDLIDTYRDRPRLSEDGV